MINPGVSISGKTVPSSRRNDTEPTRGPNIEPFDAKSEDLKLSVAMDLPSVEIVVCRLRPGRGMK